MPKRTDLHCVLVLGSGPIQIGRACEFDYSGPQALEALRDEGIRPVLLNSNPARNMPGPSRAAAHHPTPLGRGVLAPPPNVAGNPANGPGTPAPLTRTWVATRPATTPTFVSGANPSNYGAAVTLTATVTAGATGSVTFSNGTTVLGTAALNGSAQAVLTTTSLAVGWNAITARYSGNATLAPSTTVAALCKSVHPPACHGKTTG